MKKYRVILFMFVLWLIPVVNIYAGNGATVLFSHIGSNDPVNNEGWTQSENTAGNVSTGPIHDNGDDAWFVNDSDVVLNSGLNYRNSPTQSQIDQSLSNGWTLRTRLRVVDINDGVDFSVSVFYQIAQQNGNLTYAMLFGSQADGDPIIRLRNPNQSDFDFALEGTGGGYHTYELIYNPIEGSADLFVDGIERISNYAGYLDKDGLTRVQWGSARSDTTGHANYNLIQFLINSSNSVPAATLVSQWEFDGNFTAANDSNYNGNPSGTVTFVTGQNGQAANFDGGEAIGSYNTTIDYVDSQKTTPASDFNGGFSIMGWIKPEDQVSGYFLDHDESCCTTSAYGFGAYVGSPGTVSLFLRDSSDRRMFGKSSVGAVPVGTWSHVALTWDGSTSGGIKIYVNGLEIPITIRYMGAFSGLTGSAPLSLRIGSIHANSLNMSNYSAYF